MRMCTYAYILVYIQICSDAERERERDGSTQLAVHMYACKDMCILYMFIYICIVIYRRISKHTSVSASTCVVIGRLLEQMYVYDIPTYIHTCLHTH